MTPEQEVALEQRLKKLEEENQKLHGEVQGAEKLVQQHKTEIGEARKEIKSALDEFGSTIGDKDSFKKALDRLNKIEDNPVQKIVSGQANVTGPKRDVEELQKNLTAEQKAKADEVFKKLQPQERIALKGNPEALKQFLSAAVEALPSVPESLFDEPTKKDASETVNQYRKAFGLVNKEAAFVPGSSGRSLSGFAGSKRTGQTDEGQPTTEKRLPGGIIPRPADVKNIKTTQEGG